MTTVGLAMLLPVWRELLLWLGGVDAGRATACSVLRNGWSLYILPGGEAEQVRQPIGQRTPTQAAAWQAFSRPSLRTEASSPSKEVCRRLTHAALACVCACSC